MPSTFRPNDTKFKELVLFISDRSEGDPRFGATKLNKLLFYADFLSYLHTGKPITGHSYQRLKNGPAPKALVPILRQMEAEECLAIRESSYHDKVQKRTIALRDPNTEVFSGPEIDLVTRLIDENWGRNATAMSGLSHRFIGWKAASDGEVIPYETAMVHRRKATRREARIAKELDSVAKECLAQDET